jgi:hypothetical protein
MPQVETATPNPNPGSSNNTGFSNNIHSNNNGAPLSSVVSASTVSLGGGSAAADQRVPTSPRQPQSTSATPPALPRGADATSTDHSATPEQRKLLASDESSRNALIERLKRDPAVQGVIEELKKFEETVLSRPVLEALEAKLRGEGPDAFSVDVGRDGSIELKAGAWLPVREAPRLLLALEELARKVKSGEMTVEDAQFQTALKSYSGGGAGIVQGPPVLTADYVMEHMLLEWSIYRLKYPEQLKNRAMLENSGQKSLLDQVIQLEIEREEEHRQRLQRSRSISSYDNIGNIQNVAGTIDQLLAGGVDRSILSYALARAEGNVTEHNALKSSANGHSDPGNGARNTGRFSVNSAYHGTFASASDADSYFWNKVEAEARRIAPILERSGLQISALNVSAYLSFWLQSPAQAAHGLIPQFSQVAQQGATVEAWRAAMHNAADRNPLNPTGSTLSGWWTNMPGHIRDQNRRLGEVVNAINRAPSLNGAVVYPV